MCFLMSNFGGWLRDKLEQHRIHQTQLAYMVGVTPAQVSRIISGERSPSNEVLVKAEDIRLICKKAGIPYLSPHKLRHGHTVYALKRAQNVAQLKAVSQNIMHKSLVTTDQIYGNLVNDDVQDIIAAL